MKKVFLFILVAMLSTVTASEEEPKNKKQTCKSKGYSSRDTTVLSMMGWGIAIFAGIAVLCALAGDNPSDTPTTTTTTP